MADGKQSKGPMLVGSNPMAGGKTVIAVGPNGNVLLTKPNGELVYFEKPSIATSGQALCIAEHGSPELSKMAKLLKDHEKYFPKDLFGDAVRKKTWLKKKDVRQVMGCSRFSFAAFGHLLDAI